MVSWLFIQYKVITNVETIYLLYMTFTIDKKKPTWTGSFSCKHSFLQRNTTRNIHTAQKRLPFKQFQVLLTPSSGSFSSFPHGTCSLSVSRPYLAWDGTYHPLRAAIPNNSTLWNTSVQQWRQKVDEAITLHGGVFQQHLPFVTCLLCVQQTTILFLKEILNMSFSLFTRHY